MAWVSRIFSVVVATSLVGAGAAFAAEDRLGGACKEIKLAQVQRVLGKSAKVSSGADSSGGRTHCFVSIGGSGIAITSEPAGKLFRYVVELNRSSPQYAKGFAKVKLGDEGYSYDAYDAGSAGSIVFNAHVLLFRVGSRMFTVVDEKRRGKITAAARLALARAVVKNARAK